MAVAGKGLAPSYSTYEYGDYNNDNDDNGCGDDSSTRMGEAGRGLAPSYLIFKDEEDDETLKLVKMKKMPVKRKRTCQASIVNQS